MDKAIVKYNNGNGALLCNGCYDIIRYGFDHVDTYYYCDKCKEHLRELTKIRDDKVDNNQEKI